MAYNLRDLAPVGILFVVVAIALGFGAEVLDEINADLTAGTPQSIAGNGTEALSKLGKWLPTVALVVVAAILIGVVASAFFMGRR